MISSHAPQPKPTRLWLPGMGNEPEPIPEPPSRVTMQEYFDQTFLPEAKNRRLSSSRIGEIEQAIFRWKWWMAKRDRTVSPELGEVDAKLLNEFKRDLFGAEIPGRDGRNRVVKERSLNKTLGAIEQLVAAARDDGTLDDSRGLLRIRKVPQPKQVDKLVIPDGVLSNIMEAAAGATWPEKTVDGRPIDAGVMWQTAVALFATFGMRTEDLLRYKNGLRTIHWGSVLPPGVSPAPDGVMTCEDGWLAWLPNKTGEVKDYFMCLPMTKTCRYHLDRWRESMEPAGADEPVMMIPKTRECLYGQWRAILKAADAKPKPKIRYDSDGRRLEVEQNYKIKHLRCTAATRGDNHGSTLAYAEVGQWITGHVKNAVFARHYRSMERPIFETLTSLPMPAGFSPELPPERPQLRVVG